MTNADYDIVITGGHVIDPANGVDDVREVAIAAGRIAAVAARLPPHSARQVVDAAGHYVTPGLIDFHAHLYWGRDYLGIDADSLAWRCGVTTWVDAGSAGAFSIPGLREHVVRRSALRMFAFINISYLGIPGMNYDEYCNPKACDVPLLARVVEANRDFIVGVKVRMGKEGVCYPGLRPLHKAVEAAEATGLPIMCHISDTPPPVDQVLALLRPGDIVTHAFTGAGERLVDRRGRVRPAALRAKAAGVRFDVGHGAGSFSFESAEALARADFWPDAISTDLHQISLVGPNLVEDQEIMPRVRGDGAPQLTLLTVMTKFLALGMPLFDVIRATTAAPAAMMGHGEVGALTPGSAADVTILSFDAEAVELFDIHGARRQFDRTLRAVRAFVGGRELAPRQPPERLPWIRLVEPKPAAADGERVR
ncbi:MAG TPA: amidohydrolase/deacetylase family metallohydrolase [Thermomicrobiales bacterium]|nr:amidohydrolase/deacetylase family metallohydrolase [Thermomicrobiales bacterium]